MVGSSNRLPPVTKATLGGKGSGDRFGITHIGPLEDVVGIFGITEEQTVGTICHLMTKKVVKTAKVFICKFSMQLVDKGLNN